jgi:UDP-glucose 4-epimerase
VKVLVTGGCGFVGANLVRALISRGFEVIVVDNFSTGKPKYLEGLDVAVVEGDVRTPENWASLLKGCAAIIHLAAHTRVPASVANPALDFDINVRGTFAVLSAAREYGVERFIFASSNAPLGRQEPPGSEDKAPLPISPYGASKLAGEAYCLAFHGSYGMHTVGLRFSNLYGPFAGHKDSVVAKFFNDAVSQHQITIFGDGSQTRDLIYVDDLIEGILLALTEDKAAGEIIQLATGIETSIIAVAHEVQALTPFDVDIIFEPIRTGDIYRNYSNIAKARQLLGFNPVVTLRDGLRMTFEWFQQADRRI